jgi:hypothetical protein
MTLRKLEGTEDEIGSCDTASPAKWFPTNSEDLNGLSSPNPAPSDCHLFPGLKKKLKVGHFSSDTRTLLPRRPGWTDKLLNFFLSGLQSYQRAQKCIELRGECAE